LMSSKKAKEKYYDDYQLVKSFGEDIAEYFPNYVGVVGEGFYVEEELRKLSFELPMEFYGKGEVIGFSQYTYGLIKEMFPEYYHLEAKITSHNKIESIIYREAGIEDPAVHILH